MSTMYWNVKVLIKSSLWVRIISNTFAFEMASIYHINNNSGVIGKNSKYFNINGKRVDVDDCGNHIIINSKCSESGNNRGVIGTNSKYFNINGKRVDMDDCGNHITINSKHSGSDDTNCVIIEEHKNKPPTTKITITGK